MRLIHCLLLALLLGCPADRSDDDEATPAPGRVGHWAVITAVSEEGTESFQAFLAAEVEPTCAEVRAFYRGYWGGFVDYMAAWSELVDSWSDVEDAQSHPDYRRQLCQLVRDYQTQAGIAMEPVFGVDAWHTGLRLLQPDEVVQGEPAEGSYPLTDEDLDDLGPGVWAASGTYTITHSFDWVDQAAAIDCETYATDPEAELPDFSEAAGESSDVHDLVAGTVVAVQESADAWTLSVSDGVALDEEGTEHAYELAETFARCPVTIDFTR